MTFDARARRARVCDGSGYARHGRVQALRRSRWAHRTKLGLLSRFEMRFGNPVDPGPALAHPRLLFISRTSAAAAMSADARRRRRTYLIRRPESLDAPSLLREVFRAALDVTGAKRLLLH
jgi:hypothetical protein